MSILIRGLKMPKNCGECPFQQITLGIDGKPVSFCTALWKFNNPLSDKCPLIEVPKHGRLIDADAAMKAACEALCHLGVFCPDNLCKEVRETFDAVPTIIESEKEDG